jgi:16S rRNA (guanine527-N7)-methyltransferase
MYLLNKYFPDLSPKQLNCFERLQQLYSKWNSQINVISKKDINNLYEHHILHSLSVAKVIQFKKNTKILDIGTGGGFPGIPLSIFFPNSYFYLNDSIGKKIKVVKAITNELDLKNVYIEHKRAEDINKKFDFIIGRAVTNLPDFYKLVKNKIYKNGFNDLTNGILYLKGGDIFYELKKIKTKYKIYCLNKYFFEDFYKTKKLIYLY